MGDLGLSIVWSEPTKVQTKVGSKWVRWWIIPQDWLEGFFIFWGKSKDKLRPMGYSVSKNKLGKWCLNEWSERKGEFKESFGKENPVAPIKVITESTLPEYKVKNVEGLREWQIPSVGRLCSSIQTHGAAIDGSDTGTGKTYAAIAVARELGMKIAVVCPKAVIYAWKKVIEKHFKVDYVFIINYESLKTGKFKDIGTWKPVSKISTKEYFQWNVAKNTLIIFDESHRLKGWNTQNSEMAMEAKRQKYKILCCSATNSITPIDLKTTGFILGLYKKNFTQFLREHDCEKGRFGWEFGGDANILKKLHGDLFVQRGTRLCKNDIEGFPDCENIAESYNIDETSEKELKEIYEEMDRELTLLNIKCKTSKEYQMNAMTIQLRARQKSELLKLPLMIEMVEDSIEEGMSVCVFVNFSETVRALMKRLKTDCVVWGENKGQEREQNVEDFQNDKKRVIILNIEAGGVGISLHDLTGKYARIALISPPLSAVSLVQALGRIHRAGAKSKAINKLLFVSGTAEEETCERLKVKLNNLSIINDGDLSNLQEFKEKNNE